MPQPQQKSMRILSYRRKDDRSHFKQIYEWKAQWVDIGGAAIESEVVYHDEGESFPGIIKIPFDAIKSIKALTTTKAVSITFCDGTSLGDILDGGRDMNWVKVFDCTIEFCFDSMVCRFSCPA